MNDRPRPPLDLRQLRYFVAVAEELHFGHAAARLGISQPPLSEQIKALEQRVGARLLERTNRRVTLTSSGRLLYAEAAKLLAHAERVRDVMQDARSGQTGQLYLGCVPSGLYGTLPSIMEAHRASRGALEIIVTEAHTAEILPAVLDGRLDAGLVWDDEATLPLGIRPLERVCFVVALPTGHRFSGETDLALADLAIEPLIMPPRAVTPHQFDRIIAGYRRAGVTPRIGHEVRSIPSQLGFVASGLGYALVPEYARKLAMIGVEFRPLRDPLESVPLSLVWNQKRISPQLGELVRLVDQVFGPPGEKGGARPFSGLI